MSNEFVMVPRELAQFIADGGYCRQEKMEELRSILAKPSMHQGEPVALPERKDPTQHWVEPGAVHKAEGWNACLDEIAKLGPLYTRPAQGEPVAWLIMQDGKIADVTTERYIGQEWHDRGGEVKALYTHADHNLESPVLGDLVRLAKSIGPQVWEFESEGIYVVGEGPLDRCVVWTGSFGDSGGFGSEEIAQYMAAANPSAILAMAEEIERLQGIEKTLDHYNKMFWVTAGLTAEDYSTFDLWTKIQNAFQLDIPELRERLEECRALISEVAQSDEGEYIMGGSWHMQARKTLEKKS